MVGYAVIRELKSLKEFLTIWVGQFVSLVGSGLTGFALDLWIYQQTGSVTQFALIALFNTVPPILVAPIAGIMVDRWDRRWTLILSDFGAGIATLFIALQIFFTSELHIWQICIAITVIATCGTFQRLASTVATALLVPEKHLGRASGLIQIGESFSDLFVPALAGILILSIQLKGILLIDFGTYLVSLASLLIVKFPKSHAKPAEDRPGIASLIQDAIYGWKYIRSYPGLLGLLLYFVACNFTIGIIGILLIPMLLSFTSSATAGLILTFGGIGTLIGSVLMGVWGGPKRRIYGTLGFGILLGICIIVGGLRPSVPLVTAAAFGGLFCFPLIAGCSQVLLLSKVAHEVQGRVFALQGMIATSSLPLAYVVAGPLADFVFEPLLADGGLLAGSVGSVIGVGAGRGIGLLFIFLGIFQILVTIYGYLYKPLRFIDNYTPQQPPC
jgi:MFS family permease